MRWLTAFLFLVFALGVAPRGQCAQRTELIEFLHMDAELGYDGEYQLGKLREQDADAQFYEVAKFNHARHEMGIDIEFGVAPMLELDLTFPIVFQDRLWYRSATNLTYDVNEDRATMLSDSAMAADELKDDKRAGFGDMWIALQFAPFNEASEKRPAAATLLFELGISPPTGKNRYEVSSGGTMSPGSGGTDVRLSAAFSKRMLDGEPYLWASYVATGPYEHELTNSLGQSVYGAPVQLNPANVVQVQVGTEIYAMHNPTNTKAINVDIWGGFSYYTWADIEAGDILPVIHENTEGYLTTTAEYLQPEFGLGLYIRPTEMVQIRLNLGADYEMSHLVERLNERNYEIYTGMDTLRINFGLVVAGSFSPPKKGAATSPVM